MSLRRRNRRSISSPLQAGGFTLVELLVVITIIGILAALLLPALSRSKVSSQRAPCISNLWQVSLAIHLYVGDNGDTFPAAPNLTCTPWKPMSR